MKFTIEASCGNAPKALALIQLIQSKKDERFSLLYQGEVLHIQSVLTHGKSAVVECRTFKTSWTNYLVLVDWTSAGGKTIQDVKIYKAV